MGSWEKVRMAGYLGLAMIVGYWTASQLTLSGDALRETPSPSGITASTGITETASTPAVVYHNCDEARAAGAAPIYEGEPGYAPWLDGDNDGIAYEPYYGPVKHFGRKTAERRKSRYSTSP